MSKRRTFERPMHLLTRTGQVAKLTLADGFRFVVLVRNEPPTLVPIYEHGVYEIDVPELLAKGSWPVGVTTIDCAQVPAFLKIPAATVTRLLDAAALHAAQSTEEPKP